MPPELEPDVLPPEPALGWDPPDDGEFGLAAGGGELLAVDAEFPVPPQAVKKIEEAASKAGTRTGLQRIGAPNYIEDGLAGTLLQLDWISNPWGCCLPPAIECLTFDRRKEATKSCPSIRKKQKPSSC